jgi:hypothetical protein
VAVLAEGDRQVLEELAELYLTLGRFGGPLVVIAGNEVDGLEPVAVGFENTARQVDHHVEGVFVARDELTGCVPRPIWSPAMVSPAKMMCLMPKRIPTRSAAFIIQESWSRISESGLESEGRTAKSVHRVQAAFSPVQ